MEKCRKGDNQVVVGCSMNVKCKVDHQTIIANCQISKTQISTLKASMAVFWDSRLEQVRRIHVVIRCSYWSFD